MNPINLEGKALPDWFYVKTEMLQSSFNADICMASYFTNKKINKHDLIEAKKWIIDLYLKLEPKIKDNDKNKADMDKIARYIETDRDLTPFEWREALLALNQKLDDLGVTKIEMPIKPQMKHPLLRGNRYG